VPGHCLFYLQSINRICKDRDPGMTPPQTNSQTSIHTQGNNPLLLRIYVGYRLLLSVLFLTLVQLQWAPHYLGSDNHQLFSLTIIIYTVANLVTAALFHWSNWKPGETAVFAMSLIDTLAITLIMHASGSLDGSLGYLLMVTVVNICRARLPDCIRGISRWP
jgi:two-component system sensor histidine kinase PilS (NtrC family)